MQCAARAILLTESEQNFSHLAQILVPAQARERSAEPPDLARLQARAGCAACSPGQGRGKEVSHHQPGTQPERNTSGLLPSSLAPSARISHLLSRTYYLVSKSGEMRWNEEILFRQLVICWSSSLNVSMRRHGLVPQSRMSGGGIATYRGSRYPNSGSKYQSGCATRVWRVRSITPSRALRYPILLACVTQRHMR